MAISRPMRRRALAAVALLSIAAGTACTKIDNSLAIVPIFAFMRDAPSFDPYEHPLPAPPGSVPFLSPAGEVLPPLEASQTALDAFAASPAGRNPLAANDQAALALGQRMYERYCAVCHGAQAHGDGPLVGPGKFPAVPSLVTAPATERADGYLYGIIRAGRGLMPAYGARMSHIERWAVVTYVNQLQSNARAAAPAAAPDTVPAQR